MATMIQLPANAGPFIRRSALIDATRIDAIQHYISKLWSPFDCPTKFLPHLAWALSVDVWDENWSELRKRQVIAAAPIIHRLKGTDYAVETALNAFDLEYVDVEWWETNPIGKRGTFAITVRHRDMTDYIDMDLREQVRLAVKASKPKSRSFEIDHTLIVSGPAYVGIVTRFHTDITIGAIAQEPVADAATIGVAAP